MDDQKRIAELKAELKALQEKGKGRKVGVFKALGHSAKTVFGSLKKAGGTVLGDNSKEGNKVFDLDKVIKDLPA